MRSVRFKSFSSGSCGNLYLLGVEEGGVLTDAVIIDAGVSLRTFKKELAAEHIPIDAVKVILVTHDHMDHIRSLGSYCKYLKLPVWATPELLYAMMFHTYTLDHLPSVKRELAENEWNEIVPGLIYARYFIVPHDATQTVGYGILIDGLKFVIMTDIGSMTGEALSFASHADAVVVESNFDTDMLLNGPYPPDLKHRICSGCGHLSNSLCAEAIKRFYHKELTHIFLCHLSENNNTPELAYKATSDALADIGLLPSYPNSSVFCAGDGDSVIMQPLPRTSPSRLFTLRQETDAILQA